MKSLTAFIRLCFAITISLLISACGGGGGDSNQVVASTGVFPLSTSWSNSLLPGSFRFSLSGTSNNVAVTGSGTLTSGALTAGVFEATAALGRTVVVNASFSANGQSVPLSNSYTAWYRQDFLPFGRSGGDTYDVISGVVSIPTNVRVNDAGTIYTMNIYSSSNKTNLTGSETVAYAIQPDTAETAILVLSTTRRDRFNVIEANGTAHFRIDLSGGVTRLKETLVTSTSNLTFTYN